MNMITQGFNHQQQHLITTTSIEYEFINNSSTTISYLTNFEQKHKCVCVCVCLYIYITWPCNFIINNLIIIKFTYPNITSKHKHEFHQLNSQQSLFTNKHLWVLSRKEIIQRLWDNTSPLSSNLHKAKLMLHFSSNPLNLYPLLALQVLLSSKPFFFSSRIFSFYLSPKLLWKWTNDSKWPNFLKD